MRTVRGVVGLIAGGALVLAGCSAATSTSSSSSDAARGGAPTGVSDALTGPGWDCATACPWADDQDVVAIDRLAGSGALAQPATASAPGSKSVNPPGSAAPSTTVARTPTGPVAGPSEPTVIDDNAAWTAYLAYRAGFARTGLPTEDIPVEGRQLITVVDAAGRPVAGADVSISDAAGAPVAQLRSYPDGRALFDRPDGTLGTTTYRASVVRDGASVQVALPPHQPDVRAVLTGAPVAPGAPALDVVFLLDATGSMAPQIDQLKQGIGALDARLAALPSHPDVHLGLTLYRDRGDLFTTRTFNLTGDQAAFAAALAEVQAAGGGDTPEDLEAGLHDALTKPSWRPDAAKVVVLVGDAPPHLGLPGDVRYADSVRAAATAGVKIDAIGVNDLDAQGQFVFRQLAQQTLGRFAPLPAATAEGDLVAAALALVGAEVPAP
jgi:hypothetical protein